MTQEIGSVTFLLPQSVTKPYTMEKVQLSVQTQKEIQSYDGDTNSVQGIAYWFYTNHYQLNPENLQISIQGGWHQTYPNPPHISVQFNYQSEKEGVKLLMNPNFNSNIFHFSRDPYGNWYPQGLGIPQYRRPNVITPPPQSSCSFPNYVPNYGGDKNIKSIRKKKKMKRKKTLRLIKKK